jgi:Fructose-bisphosphate aldolase class-I
MNAQELIDTARRLVAGDKGPLAMDESSPACNKRFARLGILQTEKARRAHREVQPGCAAWRIQGGDGKDMSMTTSILQLTKPAA